VSARPGVELPGKGGTPISLSPPGRQGDGQDEIIVIPLAPGTERLLGGRGNSYTEGPHFLDEQPVFGQGSHLEPPGLQEHLKAGDQLFLRHVPGPAVAPRCPMAAGDNDRLQRGAKLRFGQAINYRLADAGLIDDQHRPIQGRPAHQVG
jgi:hypothetical protein